MHVVNQGQLAAALILAGVTLPPEFNLEEAVIARKDDELRTVHPKLDKVAIDTLAMVAAAKDLAAELAIKKQEFEAGLPAGASAAEVAAYRAAHAAKTNAVLGEINALKQDAITKKAHEDAESAVLQKHGLMRNDKGELVPFAEAPQPEAALETSAIPEDEPGGWEPPKEIAPVEPEKPKLAPDPEKKPESIN